MNPDEPVVTEVDDTAEELPDFFGEEEDAPDPFEEESEAEPEEEVEAAAAEEEESTGDSKAPKTVPYRRLQKVVAERNDLRGQLGELKDTLKELQLTASQHTEFVTAISDRYGQYKNPIAQLGADADFMDAMETLAQKDAEIKGFYAKVTKYMADGTVPQKIKAEPEKPATTDARVDKIIERDARRTVADVLAPLKLQDKFSKLITNHVVANAKDLAGLDAEAIKKLTKGFMTENGFELAEMRTPVKAADEKGKPKTGRQGTAATVTTKKAPSKGETEPKFKTREEVLNHRAKALDDLIAEWSA